MRAKNMILFVIAVGCGLVASIGVSQYMEHGSGAGSGQLETDQIFVAMTDIAIGENLTAENVKLEEWPKDRVPEGAITKLEDLEERYPRQRLYAGEPILLAKLMDSKDPGSKSITIPKGYRAVSVKVSVDTTASGLIQPGDRVDLLVFFRKSSEILETGTRTILRDVNVFSVDGETERTIDADGQARNVRTISLLVKPKQAESVMLAAELGRMFLSLRRPDDNIEDTSEGETVQSLLENAGGDANQENKPKERPGQGLANWLTSQASRQPEVNVAQTIQGPAWTMKILSQDGFREFQWRDAEQLPEEVTSDLGANVSRPTAPSASPALPPGLPPKDKTSGAPEVQAEPDFEGSFEEA